MKLIEEQNVQRVLKLRRTRKSNVLVGECGNFRFISSSIFTIFHTLDLQASFSALESSVSTDTPCSLCSKRNSLTTSTNQLKKKLHNNKHHPVTKTTTTTCQYQQSVEHFLAFLLFPRSAT